VFFILLMCGSCNAIRSQLQAMGPLRRECCAINEVLRFCCHMHGLVIELFHCSDIRGHGGPYVGVA
jgi:hypothetical protein